MRNEADTAALLPTPPSKRMAGDIIDIIVGCLEKQRMAQLIVRDIDEALVKVLRERAARNGRSAEAEHRDILTRTLGRPKRKTFAEVLAAMPDVGKDADFSCREDPVEARRVSRRY